jgi:tRNA G26 N,N-dimethylase Trm1
MSKAATKTNNDPGKLSGKIQLRIMSLPEKQNIKVLECFGGEGVIWNEVVKTTGKNITVLSIDKNKYKRVQLQGDNIKFLKALDLKQFDVIDLDAWGSPVKQLEILFERKYKGIVHCTFIQSMMGRIDNKLLKYFCYTDAMIKKCQSVLTKNPMEKMCNYLAMKGVQNIKLYKSDRKNYFYFVLN